MYIYSHAVLAHHVQPLVQPKDPAEYLWGAVAPDIRYLAGLRRQVTHLPDEAITAWFTRYPQCESFIQGYRVHCLLDRIDTAEEMGGVFPLNLVQALRRRKFSTQQAGAAVELYYQKVFPQGLSLTGGHNPILEALGIRADQTAAYLNALAGYLAHPTFEAATEGFSGMGLIEDGRIEKYINAYRAIKDNRLLLWGLMGCVRRARLEQLAISFYSNRISGMDRAGMGPSDQK